VQNTINFTIDSAAGTEARIVLMPWQLDSTLFIDYNVSSANVNAPFNYTNANGWLSVAGSTNAISVYELLFPASPSVTHVNSDGANSLMNRYRVVSAGFKLNNTSSIGLRSGFITTGQALLPLAAANQVALRNLSTSKTTNSDDEHIVSMVPHDPACFNFYGYFAEYSSLLGWRDDPTTAHDQGLANQVPADLHNTYLYAMCSGAAGNSFSLEYVINYEYVPGPAFVQSVNPQANSKGRPDRVLEAMATAKPESSFWNRLGESFTQVGIRALEYLGTAALDAVGTLILL